MRFFLIAILRLRQPLKDNNVVSYILLILILLAFNIWYNGFNFLLKDLIYKLITIGWFVEKFKRSFKIVSAKVLYAYIVCLDLPLKPKDAIDLVYILLLNKYVTKILFKVTLIYTFINLFWVLFKLVYNCLKYLQEYCLIFIYFIVEFVLFLKFFFLLYSLYLY